MFSAARCLVPSLYRHPHAPACRRAPTAVSAKPSRSSRGSHRELSWDDGGGGGSDSDIDDGFFGQEQDEAEEATTSPGRPAPAVPQLRGSDVLHALQRAAAAKEANRNKKKDDVKKPPGRQRQGKTEKPDGRDVEAREVRPVVIRPEWAARIRELELRVQQLAADK